MPRRHDAGTRNGGIPIGIWHSLLLAGSVLPADVQLVLDRGTALIVRGYRAWRGRLDRA
jgi:hypothetical protein